MYTDEDLEAARVAGILEGAALERLRSFVAARRGHAAGGTEEFRFLAGGLAEVFVALPVAMGLVAVWLLLDDTSPIGCLVVLLSLAWLMAEYFARRKRLALPSIVLLAGFLVPLGLLPSALLDSAPLRSNLSDPTWLRPLALGIPAAFAGAVAHWLRFRVPVTVAVMAALGVGEAWALLWRADPDLAPALSLPLVFIGGLAIFAYGLWWDRRDPYRRTWRSDVAFWLHLVAAPMLVHPAFVLLPFPTDGVGWAAAAVAVYAGMVVVAVAVDRRAMLISGLAYVLYATTVLAGNLPESGVREGLALLLLSVSLLLLSTLWRSVRTGLMRFMPAPMAARLPPV